MSYDQNLADAAARIAYLEAELAARDAALVSLRTAALEAKAFLWGSAGGGPRYKRQLGDELDKALSAPALKRAAEELRLLRELEAADAARRGGSGTAEAMYSATDDRCAAVVALRVFRKRQS